MYSTDIWGDQDQAGAARAPAIPPRGGVPPLFDRSGRIAKPSWRAFAGEWCAALRRRHSAARHEAFGLAALPRGDGHPVIVVPGFLRADRRTRALRTLLAQLGYSVAGWGGGINCGPTATALRALETLLEQNNARFGCRVSLIGDSLGGTLARGMAARYPGRVRRVITVCSPFRLPTASPLAPLYAALAHWHSPEAADWRVWLGAPPPVPTTAIYSRRDGVVAWTSCIDPPEAGADHENVEIDAAHFEMLGHPAALRVIAERLARPEAAAAPSNE